MAQLTLRVWNGGLLSLPLPSSPQHPWTISDIKRKFTELYGFRCDFIEFRSSNLGKVFEDQETIESLHLDEFHIIDVNLLPPHDIPDCYQSYDRYIHTIQFRNLTGEIVKSDRFPPNGSIEIVFHEDKDGNYLEISKALENKRIGNQNMIEIFSLTGAQDRGFIQWTNHVITDSIVFLDLGGDSDDLEERFDQIRYKWDGINSMYWGGDIHSWQRYTRRIPLAADLTVNETSSKLQQLVISPKISLSPGSCYAVVLLHDISLKIKTAGTKSPNMPLGVAEDKLILLRVLHSEKKNTGIVSTTLHSSEISQSAQVHHILSSTKISFTVHSYHRHNTPIEFHLSLTPMTTVYDLKLVISKEYSLPSFQLIVSLNDNLLLQDQQPLLNCGLLITNIVRLWPSFRSQNPSLSLPNYSLQTSNLISSYVPYVVSISPSQYQQNVPLNTAITIRFQSVPHIARSGQYHKLLEQRKSAQRESYTDPRLVSRSLMLSCFRDMESLQEPTLNDDQKHLKINCPEMNKLLGSEAASSVGHKCWLKDSDSFETIPSQSDICSPTRSSYQSNQRFYLIEIDSLEDLEKNWKHLRYKYAPWSHGKERSSNGFYCEGDRYSWQRYTRYLPVMGAFVINFDQQILTFQPSLPLYPGSTYGILLANGVPSVPSSALRDSSSPVNIADYYTIQEDLLMIFTTEGVKKEIGSLDRMRWNRQDIQRQRWESELEARREDSRRRNGEENCLIC